jgi:hypothetical protein
MGIDIYFINETKKQVVWVKKLFGSLEISDNIAGYLSFCQGDTIKLGYDEPTDGYDVINLYNFDLYGNRDAEIERLYDRVTNPPPHPKQALQ